ncbi:MAG: hypothetical protein J6V46_04850, partial [Methanobrevibacter sp.]|nr:hypothetical protein [Methanobrevibacter sp.]
MDTGNKIIIILLILIALAALVCGFLFISNGLASDDSSLEENVTNVTNTTINDTENLTNITEDTYSDSGSVSSSS